LKTAIIDYIEDFLIKNGFEKTDFNMFKNDKCSVMVSVKWECYEVYIFKEKGSMYTGSLKISELAGLLTYNGLMDKNYKQ